MPTIKKSSSSAVPGRPRDYEPSLGKLALTQLAPRLKALQPEEILPMRVDVEAAAVVALAMYARATAPALRSRYQKQHELGEFDIAHLNNLEALAFAVLFAHAEANISRAADPGLKIPAEVVEQAIEMGERMRALCEYHLRDDPEIAIELDRLRPGTGRRDLAADLNDYARIYEIRREIVALDRKHYREADIKDARAIAGVIFSLSSGASTSKTRLAHDTLARAWTLLYHSYDEVRTVGLYFLRHNQDKHRFFPSLYVAAKSTPSSRKRNKAAAIDQAMMMESD